MNSTYVVIDTNLVINDMVNESIGNESSFRKSIDGTKSILKFVVKYPNTMAGKVKYTHTEILQYLKDNAIAWEIDTSI